MRKYFQENYFYRIMAVLGIAMVVIAVLPLIYIGRYAVPCADDYTYGYYTHAFWTTTHSLRQTFHWALYQVKASYDTWQGTFSSAFLMSLSPAIWGEGYYFLTPIIMLGMLVFSHFYTLNVLLVKILKAPKSIWCIISSIFVFCAIETMPSPVNAFYWFNGAVHYMFMHGCMILLFGLIIQMGCGQTKKSNLSIDIFACLMAVACGGSNYATALLGMLGIIFLVAFKWVIGQRRVWNWLPVLIYAFCFFKNVTAYGNNIRQENFVKRTEVEAVLGSFVQLFRNVQGWMTIPIILFVLFLVPFLWKVIKIEAIKYKYPVIVTILSICSCACMYTPSLYAMDSPGPDRLLNIAKMWFLLMLIVNIGYWMGYLNEKLPKKQEMCMKELRCVKILSVYSFVILGMICLHFVLSKNTRILDYSSYAAYVSVRAGEAQQFHQEYLDRLEILNTDESIAVIPEYTVKPWLLFFDDIEVNPDDWKNKAVALWFYKDKVYLETQSE